VNQRVNDVQDSSSRMNRVQSVDDVADYSVDVQVKSSSSQHATSSERRFTVSQMSCAVVVTHLATLALCLLVAAVLYLRCRSADDLDRPDDDEFDARHVRHLHSTGNSYMTGSDVKKMADMASETVYLRLNGGMNAYRCAGNSYLCDTSTTAVSVKR